MCRLQFCSEPQPILRSFIGKVTSQLILWGYLLALKVKIKQTFKLFCLPQKTALSQPQYNFNCNNFAMRLSKLNQINLDAFPTTLLSY